MLPGQSLNASSTDEPKSKATFLHQYCRHWRPWVRGFLHCMWVIRSYLKPTLYSQSNKYNTISLYVWFDHFTAFQSTRHSYLCHYLFDEVRTFQLIDLVHLFQRPFTGEVVIVMETNLQVTLVTITTSMWPITWSESNQSAVGILVRDTTIVNVFDLRELNNTGILLAWPTLCHLPHGSSSVIPRCCDERLNKFN